MDLIIRRVALSDLLDLRHEVLRKNLPIEVAFFDRDDDPTTWHVGLYDAKNPSRILSCASFMYVPMLDMAPSRLGWQLRGMATLPERRSRGLGGRLLQWSEKTIAGQSSIRLFWCNARIEAVQFYQRHDWRSVGPNFDIEGVGEHRRMFKQL